VPVLLLGELGGCLGRWAKGDTKIQLCGSEKWRRYTKKREWTWWKWMKHTAMQFIRR